MHLSFPRNFANAAKIVRATIERRCSPGLDRNAREKLRHPCTASKLFESLSEIQRKEADIVVHTQQALEKPERIVTPAQ
jgi:hypothetical protein